MINANKCTHTVTITDLSFITNGQQNIVSIAIVRLIRLYNVDVISAHRYFDMSLLLIDDAHLCRLSDAAEFPPFHSSSVD